MSKFIGYFSRKQHKTGSQTAKCPWQGHNGLRNAKPRGGSTYRK